MEEEDGPGTANDAGPAAPPVCVAFAESLEEWAALPPDEPEATTWAAALAHEMTIGFWKGANVRVVSSDNRMYRMLIEHISTAWRDRTADLAERARAVDASFAPAPGSEGDPPDPADRG